MPLMLLLYYVLILTAAYYAASYLFAHDDCTKMSIMKRDENGGISNIDNINGTCHKAKTQDVNGLHLFSRYLSSDTYQMKQQNNINKSNEKNRTATHIAEQTEQEAVKQKNSLFEKDGCNCPNDATALPTSCCESDIYTKKTRGVCTLQNLPDHIKHKLTLLEETCTPLPVCGQNVRVLHTPSAFYEEMKSQITQSTRSIVMTALYIGEGPLSTAFVKCLEDKIVEEAHKRARQTVSKENEIYSPFTVTLLLDYNRMQCGSSLNIIRNLLKLANEFDDRYSHNVANEHSNDIHSGTANNVKTHECYQEKTTKGHVRVNVYLFQSPNKWNSLFGRFSRAKEALGVQHTKLFIFDEMNTILTGANLSDDYFASRMDRYIVFEQNCFVAQWFSQLAHALTDISHPIIDNTDNCTRATFAVHSNGIDHFRAKNNNYKNKSELEKTHAKWDKTKNVEELNDLQSANVNKSQFANVKTAKITLHTKSNLLILPNVCGFDPSSEVEQYISTAQQRVLSFVQNVTKQFKHTASIYFMRECKSVSSSSSVTNHIINDNNSSTSSGNNALAIFDTLLFPTLQMGRLSIWHDTRVMQSLLQRTSHEDHLYLTSPYLNLYGDYAMTLLTSPSPCLLDCITASVESNGWNGQRGLAGYIPFFYLQLERAFYFLARAYGALDRIHVREFAVAGLSFHAKGIWFTTNVEANKNNNEVMLEDGALSESGQPKKVSSSEGSICTEHVASPCIRCYDNNSSKDNLTAKRGNELNSQLDNLTESKCGADTNAITEVVSSPVQMINPLSAEEQRRIQPPYLVAYGSTNYGYRSVFKDIESEAFLFTLNTELQNAQRNDLLYLLQESLPVHENRFRGKAKGRFQPVISLLAQLGQDFL